jgi:hypothetical protein
LVTSYGKKHSVVETLETESRSRVIFFQQFRHRLNWSDLVYTKGVIVRNVIYNVTTDLEPCYQTLERRTISAY